MRLCFVNPGEMQRMAVYGLAKHLAEKKNHEITIVQPSRRSKFWGKTSSVRIHDRIDVMFFPAFFLPNIHYNFPFIHKQRKLLSKLLSEQKCEIVQAHDYDYLSSIAPIFLKKICKVPIVLTSDAFPGYSWFYGDTLVDVAAKLYTYSLGKWILNSYDKVVLLYRKAIQEAEKLGVPPDRLYAIPNGIDLRDFKLDFDIDELKTKLSIRHEEKVLLFVGRLAKVKRLEILIALTHSLCKEGYKVKTLIVGDGPSKQYCEKLSEPIRENVIFLGYVPRNQVYKYYLIADVFVLPSLSEGLPTALLEAAAAEKPSVATDVNGAQDVVINGKTGYLVERSDIDSYLHRVRMLLSDENLARKMGEKAAKHVKENFNWDVIVDKYEKVYRER